MKNIRITFRLSAYQLARGLQTIRQLEPAYKLISINDIVKVIYHDYLAKMTLNKLDTVPIEILTEVMNFIDTPAKSQITLEELIAIKKSKSISEPAQKLKSNTANKIAIEINKLTNQSKASEFDDSNKTSSDISSVTDFSPPKDWSE